MAFQEYNPENIFAKIIEGKIPCFKVYESKTSMAFLDAFPQAEFHTLVVPKSKGATCFLDMKPKEFQDFFRDVQKVGNAVKEAAGAPAVHIWQNNGEESGQTVFHPHFHMVPRFKDDNFTRTPAKEMLKPEVANPLADKVKEALKPAPKPLKKAKFGKVEKVKPDMTGLNYRVKVVDAPKKVEGKGRTFHEVTVADESAAVVLSLAEEQLPLCSEGASLEIRNSRAIIVNGHIRLIVDKWGKIAASEETIEEVKTDKNMSSTEFELVKAK